MRIGFAFGDSGLIQALESVKNSFNSYTLDRLAIVAGTAALQDPSITGALCTRCWQHARSL
jgi:histidinol-phosphate aminotransferase